MSGKTDRLIQTNKYNPEGLGYCDICGLATNHPKLQFQMVYPGSMQQDSATDRFMYKISGPGGSATPVSNGLMVCPMCRDEPNPQLRFQKFKNDPLPIINARPGFPIDGFAGEDE